MKFQLTSQRLVIKEAFKVFGILVHSTEQSFRMKDVVHVYSERSPMLFGKWIARIRPFWLIFFILMAAVLAAVFLGWLILLLLPMLLALMIVAFFAASFYHDRTTTVTIDFYRRETVKSWLPDFDFLIGAFKTGTAVSKSISLPDSDALMLVQHICEHPHSQYMECQEV